MVENTMMYIGYQHSALKYREMFFGPYHPALGHLVFIFWKKKTKTKQNDKQKKYVTLWSECNKMGFWH